jgi:hypothetical protein
VRAGEDGVGLKLAHVSYRLAHANGDASEVGEGLGGEVAAQLAGDDGGKGNALLRDDARLQAVGVAQVEQFGVIFAP